MYDLIDRLKTAGVVLRGETTLSSGTKSNVYFDFKKIYGNHELLIELVDNLHRLIEDDNWNFDFIAGYDVGGSPLATAICILYNHKLTLVRPQAKDHGTKRLIEGYIPQETDIGVVVDDVFTTGNSLSLACNTIQSETRAHISGCYVLLKRSNNYFNRNLKYLFTAEDFLK